jgi:hypothetical protein
VAISLVPEPPNGWPRAIAPPRGSLPDTANAWNLARGRRPSSAAFASLMISAAEAPSVSGEELPAVTCQVISGKRSA